MSEIKKVATEGEEDVTEGTFLKAPESLIELTPDNFISEAQVHQKSTQ